MKKRSMLLATLGVASITQATERPNIIFIITDDQPMESIHSWGGDVYTPNIDRLTNEGLKLERAYATSSVSAPSRYSLVTGRYPGRCQGEQFMNKSPEGKSNYMDNTVMVVEDDLPTLPKMLQEVGYKTGIVGKWHLGYHFEGNNDEKRQTQWEEAGLRYYDPASDPTDPTVEEALLHNHSWYATHVKKAGFDYADNLYWANLKEVHNTQLNYHNIDWSVKGAIDFMQSVDDEEPFFLYFSTTLHHGPTPQLSVPDTYECVTSKGIVDAPMGVMPSRASLTTRLEELQIADKMEYTLWLDDAVGALMDELERSGKADNTLIIFISDHGIKQKSSLYEGGIQIPMMMWWQDRIVAGSTSQSLVSTCDMVPTALDVAGIVPNEDVVLDGKSLVELFDAPETCIHHSIFAEVGNAKAVVTDSYKYIAVNWSDAIQEKIDNGLTPDDADWKSIGYITNAGLTAYGKTNENYFDKDQLYNLENDISESTNLADDKSYILKLSELQLIMSEYLSTFTNRPFRELSKERVNVILEVK